MAWFHQTGLLYEQIHAKYLPTGAYVQNLRQGI
jgi:hypothetical protein